MAAKMNIDHRKCLEVMCRLCGQERAIPEDRQPITKEGLSSIIKASFGIDVNTDLAELHPPFVCKACDVKLRKWWVKSKKRGKSRSACTIDLVVFEEVSCPKCERDAPSLMSHGRMEDWKEEGMKSGLLAWQGSDWLQFIRMNSEGRPVVFFKIFSDLSWQLEVAGVVMRNNSQMCAGIPVKLDVVHLQKLLKRVTTSDICDGNRDFQELVQLVSSEGQVPVQVTCNDVFIEGTIRHNCCHLLCHNKYRCSVCQLHRSELMKMLSRQRLKSVQIVAVNSPIPNKALTTSQLQQKVSLLQSERRSWKRRANTLQDKVTEIIRQESVLLENSHDTALRNVLGQCGNEMTAILGKDSAASLLWEQQQAAAVKGKQMRWHPAIIRWCIALHSKSSSGYNILRQTGFLKLPHPNTLHAYTHFTEPTTGFNAAMLQRIVEENESADHERNVSVLFDEMKVKSGLFFSVRSGKVVGFTDVTSIANEVADFERRCRGDTEPTIATHVLVLMVRGIFSSLHAPVGYYPSTGVTSDQLYLCLYEAILFLETAGFQVRALVSDGASPNRKFYRLHSNNSSTIPTYYTINPFDPARKIFFICDVPHLVKTTRNNWENSCWHNKTKTLCFNKQAVSWPQLVQLYEWDAGLDRCSPGLRRLHKISYEHLHLTPALRMRVYMAAQVLSSTVANAFESLGKVGTSSTVKFITLFDQFFDCLNVSNTYKGARSRKPALAPYKSPDDWRFDWLMKDFLGFLNEWDEEVQSHQELDKATKKKMCLSKETVEGIKITDVVQKVESEIQSGQTRLFAVVYLAGQQFKVTTNDLVQIQQHILADVGERIRLQKVLLVGGDNFSLLGRPVLSPEQVQVEATVIEKTKSQKMVVFKMKKRTRYRNYHEKYAPLSVLRINSIEVAPKVS